MKTLCPNRRTGFWIAIAVAIAAAVSSGHPAHAAPVRHAVVLVAIQ